MMKIVVTLLLLLSSLSSRASFLWGTNAGPSGPTTVSQMVVTGTGGIQSFPTFYFGDSFLVSVTNGFFTNLFLNPGIYVLQIGPVPNRVTIYVPNDTNIYNYLQLTTNLPPTIFNNVIQLVAGTNITLSPSNGLGVVTINASGGAGTNTNGVITINGLSGNLTGFLTNFEAAATTFVGLVTNTVNVYNLLGVVTSGTETAGAFNTLGAPAHGYSFVRTGSPGFYYINGTSVSIQRQDGTPEDLSISGSFSAVNGITDNAIGSSAFVFTDSNGQLLSGTLLPSSTIPPGIGGTITNVNPNSFSNFPPHSFLGNPLGSSFLPLAGGNVSITNLVTSGGVNNTGGFVTNQAIVKTGYTNGVTSMISSNEITWRTNFIVTSGGTWNSTTNTFLLTNSGCITATMVINATDVANSGNFSSCNNTVLFNGNAGNSPSSANILVGSANNTYAAPAIHIVAGGFYVSIVGTGADTMSGTAEFHEYLCGTNCVVTANYPQP